MVNRLEATDELVHQLERVHSLLQFEDELSFNKAAGLAARELKLTKGYTELLLEILIERSEYELELIGEVDRLRFIGSHDLDIDVYDLERLDLAKASMRLVDRRKLLDIEVSEVRAAAREAKQRDQQHTLLIQRLTSAREALKRSQGLLSAAEREVTERRLRSAELTQTIRTLAAELEQFETREVSTQD